MKVKEESYNDEKLRFILSIVLTGVNFIIFTVIASIALLKKDTDGLFFVFAVLGGITLASVSKLYVEHVKA